MVSSEGEGSTSLLGHFIPGVREGFLPERSGTFKKRKIFCSFWESNYDFSINQPLVSI